MAETSIEWTDTTWNPLTGCDKVSAGCKNCYAERMATRLQAMGSPRYANGFRLTLHPDKLNEPLRWKKPRMVFVNSMSDLFHEEVPVWFIRQVWNVMGRCRESTFQVLTKRAGSMHAVVNDIQPRGLELPNVWLGVSVERHDVRWRIDDLRRTNAAVRFLSIEPLLGPLRNLYLTDIHWVIVGGESGPRARPMDLEWARDIRDQCIAVGVPFFMKQTGSVWAKANGQKGKGGDLSDIPEDLRIRQLPGGAA